MGQKIRRIKILPMREGGGGGGEKGENFLQAKISSYLVLCRYIIYVALVLPMYS